MENKQFRYYNHALLPACAPHEIVDTAPIENGDIWKLRGGQGEKPYFATWVSDFDCEKETSWWYVIKDDPFDIDSLKSKRRWEIQKARKNFEVREIKYDDYRDVIKHIWGNAYEKYPQKYSPRSTTGIKKLLKQARKVFLRFNTREIAETNPNIITDHRTKCILSNDERVNGKKVAENTEKSKKIEGKTTETKKKSVWLGVFLRLETSGNSKCETEIEVTTTNFSIVNDCSEYSENFSTVPSNNEKLVAFAQLSINGKYINYAVHKSDPAFEKMYVNEALVDGVLEYFKDELAQGSYISDGSRNIIHETKFQDFLERKFGFRKAYCTLHIKYRPFVRVIVGILYPFRKVLKALGRIGFIHQINGVLMMEECRRV